VLPAFRRTVVHDALSVYDAYPSARHALCCAHLARELVAAAEAHPDQVWPEQALGALHGLNSTTHQARDQQFPAIPPEIAQPLLDSRRHTLLVGLAEHRRVPGRRQSKTPQPARTPARTRPPAAAVRARSLRAVHQQPGRERRPSCEDPEEDEQLPPLRDHREGLAPRPKLLRHLRQAQPQHPLRVTASRQPLETT
jgi:Transposase IS66 family